MQLIVDFLQAHTDLVAFLTLWLAIGFVAILVHKRRLEREVVKRTKETEESLEQEARASSLQVLEYIDHGTQNDVTDNSIKSGNLMEEYGSTSQTSDIEETSTKSDKQELLTQYTSGDGGGVEEMERMLAQDPDNVQLLDWLAFMYYSNDAIDKAIATYERIIEIDPTNASQHYYLGNCHYKNHDFDEARKEWQIVVQLKPNSKYARKAQDRMMKVETHV